MWCRRRPLVLIIRSVLVRCKFPMIRCSMNVPNMNRLVVDGEPFGRPLTMARYGRPRLRVVRAALMTRRAVRCRLNMVWGRPKSIALLLKTNRLTVCRRRRRGCMLGACGFLCRRTCRAGTRCHGRGCPPTPRPSTHCADEDGL